MSRQGVQGRKEQIYQDCRKLGVCPHPSLGEFSHSSRVGLSFLFQGPRPSPPILNLWTARILALPAVTSVFLWGGIVGP